MRKDRHVIKNIENLSGEHVSLSRRRVRIQKAVLKEFKDLKSIK
jgi:hypothetical protein